MEETFMADPRQQPMVELADPGVACSVGSFQRQERVVDRAVSSGTPGLHIEGNSPRSGPQCCKFSKNDSARVLNERSHRKIPCLDQRKACQRAC